MQPLQREKPLLSKDGSVHVTDEFYNTVIAAFGAVASLIGVILLISNAWLAGQRWQVLGFSIYGFGLVNVFVARALHHGVNGSPRVNHLLRQYDYFAISLMIAGTFTPFCLILLRNTLGWSVLILVWFLALLGIALKAIYPNMPRWLNIALFVGMGWLAVLIAKPVYLVIHWQGAAAMFVGGLFFTVGALIYGLEKPNPFPGKFGFHEIWHCFVLAGAASHFYIMHLLLFVPS